jgi:hypothetical protein
MNNNKKSTKAFSLSPSEKLVVDRIYDDMRKPLGRVVEKYMNVAETKDKNSETLFYPLYVTLAVARLADHLTDYNRTVAMLINNLLEQVENHNKIDR